MESALSWASAPTDLSPASIRSPDRRHRLQVIGHHALKFGYDGRRFNVSNPFSARNNGAFGFNDTNSPFTSGDGCTGLPARHPRYLRSGFRSHHSGGCLPELHFAQDTWKVTDSLTLDYGLGLFHRYSAPQPSVRRRGIACSHNGFNSTLFAGAPTGIAYPGEGGCNKPGGNHQYTSLDHGSDSPGLPRWAGSPAARGSSPSAAASASTTTARRKSLAADPGDSSLRSQLERRVGLCGIGFDGDRSFLRQSLSGHQHGHGVHQQVPLSFPH